MKPDYETIAFKDHGQWRQWLDEHHDSIDGVWVKLYKKASGIATVTYAEALDEALCFGWIDGQRKSLDEVSFVQKFTPRRSKSLWSKRNIEHVTRLKAASLMTAAGIAEVQRAQNDGRWDAAYDKPSDMVIPDYFMDELSKNAAANAFFATLNKTNRYAIAWRLQTAKTDETRLRRQNKMIGMLEAGQKIV